ncbi:MAG: DUF1735 domain-containing protein [Prevotella sp.]|nr:DUF1735 domain-containing protein [Prevotella sp.]MCI1281843.1 DUF1735 domain-containing protein [Prevotella sp.]
MKKLILFLAPLLGLTAFSFTSCSDNETYDVCGNPDNLVYLSANATNTYNCKVVHTPVGEFGDVDVKFPVKIQRAATADITVKPIIDNSMIDAYNTAHNTKYVAVPDNMFNITSATILRDTIAGKDSIEVSIDKANFASLTEAGYMIPFTIEATGGDSKASEDRGTGYVIITTSTELIHKGATRDQLPPVIPRTSMGTWTCEGQNISKVSDGNGYSGWSYDYSGSTFIIDVKEVKKVGGISVWNRYAPYGTPYRITSVELSLSADGTNWTDCGTETLSEMYADSNGYQYVGLYGAVAARYIKIKIATRYSWDGLLAEFRVFAE